jgi:hypothetical protein
MWRGKKWERVRGNEDVLLLTSGPEEERGWTLFF